MHKHMLAAFLALLGSNTAALAASCSLPDVADKVHMKQLPGTNLVTVPVAINGTQKQFLLDIGTRPTMVSQRAVAELGLPEKRRLTAPFQFTPIPLGAPQNSQTNVPIYDAKGASGIESMRPRVNVGSFTIGEATGKNLLFVTASEGEVPSAAPYDGRLTNDFFKQYDVEMDFGTMQMTWLTPTQCTDPDKVAYWTNDGVAVLPMTLNDGRIEVPVTIEGHAITAVLDTSSERSVMRRDIAELTMGLKAGTPDMMAIDNVKDGMGQPVYRHTFPKLVFAGAGGVTAANVPVLITANGMAAGDRDPVLGSKAQSSEERIPALVLGMDVLHQLHLYAVFGQKRLYVTQVFFS